MGLTIHFDFEFKGSQEQAGQKLETLREKVLDLPVKFVSEVLPLDYSKDIKDEQHEREIAGECARLYSWAKIQYRQDGKFQEDGSFVKDEHEKEYRGYVLMIQTGEGCEPTNIALVSYDNRNFIGHAFTKTQYADEFVKCHLLVVKILDICKELGILKEVSDEGEYYETRSIEKLAENINISTKFIQQTLKKIETDYGYKTVEAPIKECKNYVVIKKKINRWERRKIQKKGE